MPEAMDMSQGNPTGRGEAVGPTLPGAAGEKPFDAKLFQMQFRKYMTVVVHLMYSKEMKAHTLAMIKSSDDPFITVPTAVNQVIKDTDKIFAKQGINITNEIRLAASQVILNDIIEIGRSQQIFDVTEEEIPQLMEDVMQMYIENGLKDGSIDPIQLQIDGEKLMTKEQLAGGQAFAAKGGIPLSLSQQQMTEQYGNSRARQARIEAEDKFSRERARTVQQQQQPQPQGGR